MTVRLTKAEWDALVKICELAAEIEIDSDPDNTDIIVEDGIADIYALAMDIQRELRAYFPGIGGTNFE